MHTFGSDIHICFLIVFLRHPYDIYSQIFFQISSRPDLWQPKWHKKNVSQPFILYPDKVFNTTEKIFKISIHVQKKKEQTLKLHWLDNGNNCLYIWVPVAWPTIL